MSFILTDDNHNSLPLTKEITDFLSNCSNKNMLLTPISNTWSRCTASRSIDDIEFKNFTKLECKFIYQFDQYFIYYNIIK